MNLQQFVTHVTSTYIGTEITSDPYKTLWEYPFPNGTSLSIQEDTRNQESFWYKISLRNHHELWYCAHERMDTRHLFQAFLVQIEEANRSPSQATLNLLETLEELLNLYQQGK